MVTVAKVIKAVMFMAVKGQPEGVRGEDCWGHPGARGQLWEMCYACYYLLLPATARALQPFSCLHAAMSSNDDDVNGVTKQQ